MHILFDSYDSVSRKDIVTFSSTFRDMVAHIKLILKEKKYLELRLARLVDTGVEVSNPISFFNIIVEDKFMKLYYYGDHHDFSGNRIPTEKIIRFDNPFGELPVLTGYESYLNFWRMGEDLEIYKDFIVQAREFLNGKIGKEIQLQYKNDDETFSIIHGTLKEVNRGNIFMQDHHETLVRDNKSVKIQTTVDRLKNHRFISENGYLIGIYPPVFTDEIVSDDGFTFGETKTWHFLPSLVKEI